MDRVMDYLEDRLGAVERELFETEIEADDDLRRDFELAQALHQSAFDQHLREIEPERVVEIAEGRGVKLSEYEQDHLAMSNAAKNELEYLKELPDPPEIVAERETVATADTAERLERNGERASKRATSEQGLGRLFRFPAWGLGSMVAMAAVLLLMIQPWNRSTGLDDVTELARITPLPVQLSRTGTEDPQSFDGLVYSGLEAYDNESYADAADAFTDALALEPDRLDVRLYAGSAELFAGRAEVAVDQLTLASVSPEPRVSDEAVWLLANARLILGDADEARPLLRRTVDSGGAHSVAAGEILDALP